MMKYAFVDGNFVHEAEAKISIFDRSVLFSDAVYEVTCVINRRMLDFERHMERLERSCAKIGIEYSVDYPNLKQIHQKLIDENVLSEGMVYFQVTRGVAARSFIYPENNKPTVLGFTQRLAHNPLKTMERALSLISVPEERWQKLDIKTTQLLCASLMKTQAVRFGADDAVIINDGFVTETTAANIFMVAHGNTIVTCPLNGQILPGITRQRVIELAIANGFTVEQRLFTLQDLYSAQECFVTSAVNFATPVIAVDGRSIGTGRAGVITEAFHSFYVSALIQ
ncbi:aminotransferase class IV [Brucella pituitosa]|uniref:aminotransferase class IV n=1 Tax=Brucella pituitosa TaxID=571256 RepID=UPI000F5E3D6F|nr:D-amino acid aminotransferase [Brucellaceae bacterium VT-16-1752]